MKTTKMEVTMRYEESVSYITDMINVENLLIWGGYEAKCKALELLYGLYEHPEGKNRKILYLTVEELIKELEDEL